MAQLQGFFEKYDRLVLFDTETTGLLYNRDEIIEFAAVVVEQQNGEAVVVQEYDELISLSPGGFVPPMIEKLTGISNQDLREKGIPKTRVCCDIARMIQGNTLLLAYNAHFDLSFLFYLLLRNGDPTILKGKDKLDLLTVYKDRRSYPHKLCHAIEAYGLAGKVVNSHRAVDDVIATVGTDSSDMYGSRIKELEEADGAYTPCMAAADYAEHLKGIRTDSMEELTYQARKRVHNLKYYTWVEQQGMTAEDLNAQWYDTAGTWDAVHAQAKELDALIEAFNEEAGVLKNL